MNQFLGIKYKLKSSDNFENYLKFIDVGFLSRKAALAASPDCVLTIEGDKYALTMSTMFQTLKTVFSSGEEVDEERADGSVVRTNFTVEGNKLIQDQIEPKGGKSKHVREFSADKVTVITTAEGWDGVCTRVYERVE